MKKLKDFITESYGPIDLNNLSVKQHNNFIKKLVKSEFPYSVNLTGMIYTFAHKEDFEKAKEWIK